MKHGIKWLVPLLAAVMMLLSLTATAAEGAYGLATLDQVAVRKQPSTDVSYWFRIDKGFVCQILDVVESEGEMWYKVNSTHPDPGKDNTYIGYVRATAFRPMSAEETELYLSGNAAVLTAAPVQTEAAAAAAPTLQPSVNSSFGGSFDVGIMGGATATPTVTPDYNPGAEEDDYASENGGVVTTDNGFGSAGFDTIVTNATGEVTASGTNFRIAPSTEGGLIGKLKAGTVVELVTIPSQVGVDYWYRVRYNGQEGYIQSNYVRVLTVGYTPTPAPSTYGYAKLIYDSANLRDLPGGTTRAEWKGKGSLLQIVGAAQYKNNYNWYPVFYGVDKSTYFVREDVIELIGYTGGSAATATPAPDYSGLYGYVLMTEPGVNLRLKPGGETVAQIPRGKVVPCIGPAVNPEDSDYTWYYVQYGNLRGYVRGDCVRVCTADGGNIVVTATPVPTSAPVVSTYGYIRLVKANVNLRARPAGTSQGQLPRDLILPLTGAKVESGRYDWYPVRTPDGRTGYIRSDCMVLCDEVGNEVSATPTPVPGTSVTPGTPTLSTYGYVQITQSGTNLRDTVAGDTVYQLKKGTVWPMIGISVTYGQYTWYPVQADGYTGFVRSDCAFKLSASQELSYLTNGTVPAETPAPTPTLSKYVVTVLDYVNLRASASRDAAAPFKVRLGTVMAFNGTKTVGTSNWYRVVYNDTEVWVLGSCVKVMTTDEYNEWLGDNPSAAPEASANLGYLITTEAGVNVRDEAAGSKIVARLSRGSVVPYFAEAKRVGAYSWYAVRTLDGVDGYIRSDMVKKCDENGNAIVVITPTPVPGGTTGGSQQEATYTTLRLGSSGTAVYNLVAELKNQGYYTGSVTSNYTDAVRKAVIAFQTAKGLTVDGIAGSKTQHALYGTVPPGTANTSDLTFTFYPVEKIDWYTGGIQQLWAKGANYKVYDVKTGIVWWAHRWSGASHADIEPLTAADTARLCQIYGVDDAQDIWDKNLWQRRPCLVTIGTRTFACSLMGMPHNPDGDTIDNNNMTGQICMHFTNSKGHDSGKVDSYHQKAIETAYEWAKERYGAR